VHKPPEGRCWSTVEPEFKKLLKAGRIYFGKEWGTVNPTLFAFSMRSMGFVPWTCGHYEDGGHTDEQKRDITKSLAKDNSFDTPKPRTSP